MNQTDIINEITQLLTEQLAPTILQVTSQSHLHVGHRGNQPGRHQGGGHFTIEIAATGFTNKSRIEIHREIYAILHELMNSKIHALSISIKSVDRLGS